MAICGQTNLFAQGAYDSVCYSPVVSNPDDFDTICGSYPYQHMGQTLMSLPPLSGQQYDRLLISNAPKHIPFISAVETGPQFNLHKLKFTKDYSSTPQQWITGAVDAYEFGHFRSPKYLDLLFEQGPNDHPIIFWADDNGEYDSARSTVLLPTFLDGRVLETSTMRPYVTKLTSDSVDDIVVCVRLEEGLPKRSNVVMALVKGGQKLYDQGNTAMWDDTAFWRNSGYGDSLDHDTTNRNSCVIGDLRGVGREDFIACDDWGNLYYYKNDPPFDIHRFSHAILTDTILAMREYSRYLPPKANYIDVPRGFLVTRAFSKSPADRSVDLLISPDTRGDTLPRRGICFFKGGPHFGERRINYDSCDFLLHTPEYYGGFAGLMGWPDVVVAGDITGTGNNVIVTSGGNGLGSGFLAFYVLGNALDDKIDMFVPLYHGAGWFDTIVASNKPYKTYVRGTPVAETDEQNARGVFEVGGIQLLKHGERIPVRLNSTFAVPSPRPQIGSAEVFPNPASTFLNVKFPGTQSEMAQVVIVDALGREVFRQKRAVFEGMQTLRFDFENRLSAGSYTLEIRGKDNTNRAKVSIY